MKATLISRLTLLPLLAVLCTFAAHAQTRDLSTNGQLLDRIAAVVNDGVVLKSQLDQEVTGITQRLREQKTELPSDSVMRKQVLERLVVQEIQMQRADRLGIEVSDEMLNGALQDVAKRNGISFNDLPAALERQGIDYPAYREDFRRNLTLQLLRQRDVVARVNISPRELDQFLARQANAADANLEYNLSHILISVPVAATPEQLAAREARAKEAYEKASAGENFAQLAVTYSDSTTNVEGGALGWRKGTALPSIVADQVGKMKPGNVTEPIRTPSGYHIFKLNDTRGAQEQTVAQIHARHILMKTNELEDDETVRQKLNSIRERVLSGKEEFTAIAAVTSQDTGSAAQGGDLDWAGPGTFAPEFEKQLDQLKDGEISQPFKTQFGWHIVQVLGRRMHDMSDDNRRNRAYAALREQKAEEDTELWIRRLRDEAYVDYRM
jgi:peptidyl-prolyl cis-trans isomerase SurA